MSRFSVAASSRLWGRPTVRWLTQGLGGLGVMGLVLLASSSACSKKEDKAEAAQAAVPAPSESPPASGADESAAQVPLDPELLPVQALADLAATELELGEACGELGQGIEQSLALVEARHGALSKAASVAEATALLEGLADELSGSAAALRSPEVDSAERSEADRLADELSSSLQDLAESARLLAGATVKSDRSAISATLRRIDNGVANTRSSIERLSLECAP